jgi:uncharacterized membrane protein YcjF (UPF0283 family)
MKQAGLGEMPAAARRQAEEHLQTITLRYAYGVLALATTLATAGLTAALWHNAWWIGVGFVLVALLSGGAVLAAVAQIGAGRDRLPTLPGETPEGKP